MAAYILSSFILGRYIDSTCFEMDCMAVPFAYLFPWGYIVCFLVLPVLSVLIELSVAIVGVIGTVGTFLIGWFFYKIGAYLQNVLRKSDYQ